MKKSSATTLSSFKKQQEAMGELMTYKPRFRKDVFVIPTIESLNLKEAAGTVMHLKETGYTNASFNRYTIKKTEGTSVADKVFVQLKGNDVGSKHKEQIVEVIKHAVVSLLDSYGYVSKALVLAQIKGQVTEKAYKACQ